MDKKNYTVLRPISFCGARVETGSVVPLADEEAAAWGPEFVQLADKEPELPEAAAAAAADTTTDAGNGEGAGDQNANAGTGAYVPDLKKFRVLSETGVSIDGDETVHAKDEVLELDASADQIHALVASGAIAEEVENAAPADAGNGEGGQA